MSDPTPVPIEDAPPITIHVTGLVVKPGDTLILSSAEPINDRQAYELARRVKEGIPGLGRVVVVDRVAAMAAYRPEA